MTLVSFPFIRVYLFGSPDMYKSEYVVHLGRDILNNHED